MSLHEIVITSHQEMYAPPSDVLSVSLVGDVVFLSIGLYDETHDSTSITDITQIGVKLTDLTTALLALTN